MFYIKMFYIISYFQIQYCACSVSLGFLRYILWKLSTAIKNITKNNRQFGLINISFYREKKSFAL